MRKFRKVIAFVLTIAMTVSLFAFTATGFAAEKKDKLEEFVLLSAKTKDDVTNVLDNVSADSKVIKENKYSAKWDPENGSIRTTGMPTSYGYQNELKMTLNAKVPMSIRVMFYGDNPDTDGSDYFYQVLDLVEGWQDISVNLSTSKVGREPAWDNIVRMDIRPEGEAPKGAIVYFDKISFAYNKEYPALVYVKPEPQPETEAGTIRYFEEDFETTTTPYTKNQKDNRIAIEEKDGNHYMIIEKTGAKDPAWQIVTNDLGRYVIYSMDVASTSFPTNTSLIGAIAGSTRPVFVSLNNKGELVSGKEHLGNLKNDGTFTNIMVAFDFVNAEYEIYIDGKLIGGTRDIEIAGFTTPTSFRSLMPASSPAGTNLMLDNVKIFDGKSADDLKNTITVEESQRRQLEEAFGKPSPMVDYGDKQVAYIDSINGVALNVRSGYIHAKGERYMPDVPAYIKDGRTLLPVRAVSEALDCSVDWDPVNRVVTVNGSAKITIDSKEMILPNGNSYTLDVPAEITSDRTFIPLRALCEQVLGKKVFWDDRGLIVLSDNEIEMKDVDIETLNSYMLFDRPSSAKLTEMFNSINKNTHPRVIFNQADFDRLKYEYQTNEYKKKWGDEVIKKAKETLIKPHETYIIEPGNPPSLLYTSRRALSKALNLGMAYKLTGDEIFKSYLWAEIQSIAKFPDWNHIQHYLDVGEMATAIAIIYDWLYHDWTPEQRVVMEEMIYKNGLLPTQKAVYNLCDYPNSFVGGISNWTAVCVGGTGVGAIAVFDKYPELCADLLEKNLAACENMMEKFYPDGAWYEGTGYWRYLMDYLAFFASTLKTTFDTDFNILKAPGFEKSGQFYLNGDGMTGNNNYHDSALEHLIAPVTLWFSDHMGQPGLSSTIISKMESYAADYDYEMVYPFMFYNVNIDPKNAGNMPLDSYYSETEIASLRSSWTDNEGLYVSVHSGTNHVNHGHLDAGTFVLDIGGQRFVSDLGAESYDAPGYFGDGATENRYKYYRARPEGHNTFVINPDDSYGQNRDAVDKFTAFVSKERGAYAITDLTNAYSPYARSAKRGIMMSDERRSVTIRDEIRGIRKGNENEVHWFIQMRDTEVEVVDKNTVILSRGRVKALMQIATDATDWEIIVGNARPLETSPDMPGQNSNPGCKRLDIKMKTGKDVNITVKFCQLYDKLGETPIADIPLDKWAIEDGPISADIEVPKFPKAEAIFINGDNVVKFRPDTPTCRHAVPYGTPKIESVDVKVADDVKVTNVTLPDTLPGIVSVRIENVNDSRLYAEYQVEVREAASGDTTIMVSNEQEGNEGENSLDGDLDTRWAVEGEAWGIYQFKTPKTMSSVWLATWKSAQRKLIFDIEVSTDGMNFTKVWSGTTSVEEDVLEEFKIPAGTYKAVKIVLHGTTAGTWNSILDVEFR